MQIPAIKGRPIPRDDFGAALIIMRRAQPGTVWLACRVTTEIVLPAMRIRTGARGIKRSNPSNIH